MTVECFRPFNHVRTDIFVWMYTVYESPVTGHLVWRYVRSRVVPWDGDLSCAYALPRAGHQDCDELTPEDAEVLTGLAVPAAWDRLRELVHAAPRYEEQE